MKTRMINSGHWVALVGALGIVISLPVLSAAAARHQESQPSTKQSAEKAAISSPSSEGEKKFKQNCSRCHEAPQELSAHISGTILRHMRVRASLSQQDERDILKFLNP